MATGIASERCGMDKEHSHIIKNVLLGGKMAKYTVTFSCGHTQEKRLLADDKDRESKIEYWEKEGICSACYKAEQEEKAAEAMTKYGLPELKGTVRQVAWANKIRLEMIDAKKDELAAHPKKAVLMLLTVGRKVMMENLHKAAAEKGVPEDQMVEAVKQLEDLFAAHDSFLRVKKETSAQWFIENRPL